MATTHVITRKEQKAEERARFRVICKGISKDDFAALLHAFKDDFGCKTVLRNPFPSQFDPKTVHELITHVTGDAIGGYAAKKVIDAAKELFVAFMKYRYMTSEKSKGARHVVLMHGSKNKVLYELKDPVRRPKRKK